MIGDGLFGSQLNAIEEVLRELRMLEDRQCPRAVLGMSLVKGRTYRQVYEAYISEYAYDFLLTDYSLLSFTKGGSDCHDGMLSYRYLECPLKPMPYRQFVGEQFGMTVSDDDFDEVVDELGDSLLDEYEQYVDGMEISHAVTPLRYDYKATDYKAGLHPASHFHFGHENEMRVGVERVLYPLSFTLFVIRQRYPLIWRESVRSEVLARHLPNVRHKLDKVDSAYWSTEDQDEMFLQ